MQSHSKADLHVHSKYSDRPTEWFLRRVGAPECYVEPLSVYRRAKARGMDFVTIADHNSILGALEISHLPGTFVSDEVTTYFPENGSKIHLLVCGISEEQFRMIQELRESIYELHGYLLDEGITCAVNHPFYRVNDRLTIDQVEKLLLMFKRFELINGTRDRRGAALLKVILESLTPTMIDEMADRHALKPTGPEPWRKWTTGGSDDHSGVHTASAFTVTPAAADVSEYLAHLGEGRHEAAGTSGGSLLLARSVYHVAYGYYKERFLGSASRPSILGQMLERFVSPPVKSSERWYRFVPGFVTRFVRARQIRRLSDAERTIVEEASRFAQHEDSGSPSISPDDDRHAFETVCRLAHLLSYNLIRRFLRQFQKGNIFDGIQSLASLGTVALGVAPYLASFSSQHKDEPFLRALAEHFPGAETLAERGGGKAWITDTLPQPKGTNIADLVARSARNTAHPLTLLTCQQHPHATGEACENFIPLGSFELPECDTERILCPPFLEVIEYVERRGFDELVISTPGPLGLTGLAVAGLLGIQTTGVYQTDVPLLVRQLTLDHAMEQLARKYVLWFYSQMSRVIVFSKYHRSHLMAIGLDSSKIIVLPTRIDEPHNWSQPDSRTYHQVVQYLWTPRVNRPSSVSPETVGETSVEASAGFVTTDSL